MHTARGLGMNTSTWKSIPDLLLLVSIKNPELLGESIAMYGGIRVDLFNVDHSFPRVQRSTIYGLGCDRRPVARCGRVAHPYAAFSLLLLIAR